MERSKQSAIICIVMGICAVASAKIIYVDDDAAPGGDGATWQSACKYLQDALAAAKPVEKPVEIRVAQGIYRPDQGAGLTAGDKRASFVLCDGLTLEGGYAGAGMPDPDARDINDCSTILSGDLEGNDSPSLPAAVREHLADRLDNVTYVVRVTGDDVMIDGFVITGGDYTIISRGGGIAGAGMSILGNNIKIANCTFTNNRTTTNWGGAIATGAIGSVEIVDSTFKDNYGGKAGALCTNGGSVDLYRCVFIGNRSDMSGGAITAWSGKVFAASCTFIGNTSGSGNWWSEGNGGAAAAEAGGTLEFEDSRFIGNTAMVSGGAVSGDLNSTLTLRNSLLTGNIAAMGGAVAARTVKLTNCTIAGNRAAENPEIRAGGNGSSQLFNCIVWKNEKVPPQARTVTDWLGACSYCCIDPNAIASPVIGNIEQDPAFAMPGYWDPNATPEDPNDDFWVDGDYHLKSLAGRWDPNSQRWVMDDVSSPCIDAGDPNSPVGDEPEPNGGQINMGAYGGTAEASKSHLPKTFDEGLKDLLAAIEGQAAEEPTVTIHHDYEVRRDYVYFLAAPSGTRFTVDPAYREAGDRATDWFLAQWRDLFVDASEAVSFEKYHVTLNAGRTYVRYRQKYAGLAIYGASVVIQADQSNGIVVVSSDIQTNMSSLDTGTVPVTPSIDATRAQDRAIAFSLEGYHGAATFEALSPVLMIYAPAVLSYSGPVHLVWSVEVYSVTGRNVRDQVLVDAHDEKIVLWVPLIHNR